MLNKELLEILACPICKGELILKGDKLICLKCKKYEETSLKLLTNITIYGIIMI